MNNFLAWDIVKQPDLTLRRGRLPVLDGPGLGFELDWGAVREASEAWGKGGDCGSRNTRRNQFNFSPADSVDPQGVDGKADGDEAGARFQPAPPDETRRHSRPKGDDQGTAVPEPPVTAIADGHDR